MRLGLTRRRDLPICQASTRGSSRQLAEIVDDWKRGPAHRPADRCARRLRSLKAMGFSDRRLADAARSQPKRSVRARAPRARCSPGLQAHRHLRGRVRLADAPICTRPTTTPFAGVRRATRPAARQQKIVILGGGPNRIGQGIEFDYCCCHAAFALTRCRAIETIMVNCNPETVSTDYDTSDRLYFEPLTAEDVLEIIDASSANGTLHGRHRAVRRPDAAQAGAGASSSAGVPILGTSPDAIDLAEDRDRFTRAARQARAEAAARTASPTRSSRPRWSPSDSAIRWSCARPTCLAAAMAIVRDGDSIATRSHVRARAADIKAAIRRQDRPDQHGARREPAAVRPLSRGCHRGRRRLRSAMARTCSSPASWSTSRRPASIRATAACSLPPHSLSPDVDRRARAARRRCWRSALDVGGLMNVQYAHQGRRRSTCSRSIRAPRARCRSSPR